ncbi:hypothetical protein V5799_022983 [Amblyomma americanum]|uniref:Secreted protein n=1 Tax=Amblyomma americanum TaxID=6943 RepID=A0AAQ4FKX7_AMBAM
MRTATFVLFPLVVILVHLCEAAVLPSVAPSEYAGNKKKGEICSASSECGENLCCMKRKDGRQECESYVRSPGKPCSNTYTGYRVYHYCPCIGFGLCHTRYNGSSYCVFPEPSQLPTSD